MYEYKAENVKQLKGLKIGKILTLRELDAWFKKNNEYFYCKLFEWPWRNIADNIELAIKVSSWISCGVNVIYTVLEKNNNSLETLIKITKIQIL